MITVSAYKNAAAVLAAKLAISKTEARRTFNRFHNWIMLDGLTSLHDCEVVVEALEYGCDDTSGVAYLFAPSAIDGEMNEVATLHLTRHEMRNWLTKPISEDYAISDRLRLAA